MSSLQESDCSRGEVEAFARKATEEFIERMDEYYPFLSDEIIGFELAVQIIQNEIERLKSFQNRARKAAFRPGEEHLDECRDCRRQRLKERTRKRRRSKTVAQNFMALGNKIRPQPVLLSGGKTR
jgi:hypothetical protein